MSSSAQGKGNRKEANDSCPLLALANALAERGDFEQQRQQQHAQAMQTHSENRKHHGKTENTHPAECDSKPGEAGGARDANHSNTTACKGRSKHKSQIAERKMQYATHLSAQHDGLRVSREEDTPRRPTEKRKGRGESRKRGRAKRQEIKEDKDSADNGSPFIEPHESEDESTASEAGDVVPHDCQENEYDLLHDGNQCSEDEEADGLHTWKKSKEKRRKSYKVQKSNANGGYNKRAGKKRKYNPKNQGNSRQSMTQQRTSSFRGVTKHRVTGKFEAHLWDPYHSRTSGGRGYEQSFLHQVLFLAL